MAFVPTQASSMVALLLFPLQLQAQQFCFYSHPTFKRSGSTSTLVPISSVVAMLSLPL